MTQVVVKKADRIVDVNINRQAVRKYMTQENHEYEYHPRMMNVWWESMNNPSETEREKIIVQVISTLEKDPRFAFKDIKIWSAIDSRHPFFGDNHIRYDKNTKTVSEESNTWSGRKSNRLNEAVYGKLEREYSHTCSYPSNSVSYYNRSVTLDLPFIAIENTKDNEIWLVFF